MKVGIAPEGGSRSPLVRETVSYGAAVMIALAFANALQNGENAAFGQAIDSFEQAFHVTDATIGVVTFVGGVCGAFGALPIAWLCGRYRRITVLTGMFAAWTASVFLAGLLPALILGTTGLVIFVLFRVITSVTEATDPAVYPLIADYWPVDKRATRISVFQGLAGVGSTIGIVGAGFMVDGFGWVGAFYMWVPLGLIAMFLIATRPEPVRGAQDAEYEGALKQTEEVAHLEAMEARAESDPTAFFDPRGAHQWQVMKAVLKLKTWRWTAIFMGVAQMMQTALMLWGIPYMKRTYDLSGAEASSLIFVLAPGAAIGVFVGGYVADRLLRHGIVRARVWCAGGSYVLAGLFCLLAFGTAHEAFALTMLAIAAFWMATATGPSFAMLLDVTPFLLRSQAAAASNILMLVSALGNPIVGGLSTMTGDLRIALFLASPLFLVGGLGLLALRGSYMEAVDAVVIDAKHQARAHHASLEQSP